MIVGKHCIEYYLSISMKRNWVKILLEEYNQNFLWIPLLGTVFLCSSWCPLIRGWCFARSFSLSKRIGVGRKEVCPSPRGSLAHRDDARQVQACQTHHLDSESAHPAWKPAGIQTTEAALGAWVEIAFKWNHCCAKGSLAFSIQTLALINDS